MGIGDKNLQNDLKNFTRHILIPDWQVSNNSNNSKSAIYPEFRNADALDINEPIGMLSGAMIQWAPDSANPGAYRFIGSFNGTSIVMDNPLTNTPQTGDKFIIFENRINDDIEVLIPNASYTSQQSYIMHNFGYSGAILSLDVTAVTSGGAGLQVFIKFVDTASGYTSTLNNALSSAITAKTSSPIKWIIGPGIASSSDLSSNIQQILPVQLPAYVQFLVVPGDSNPYSYSLSAEFTK